MRDWPRTRQSAGRRRVQSRPVREAARPLRCAVYTRKSSEEGLEQDFNSLHAQREACEAYIKSRSTRAGSSCRRPTTTAATPAAAWIGPGSHQLLADIASRQIDVVVVYKVDRLTRSLTDFAQIVEVFDAQGV